MKKVLLFSDIHIHTHKNSLKRLQHCLDTLKWVFETATERDINDVIFLGDLFQDREKIQVLPYLRTYEIINKYCGGDNPINLYMLIGNHDMWFADKTDVSSVYPLGSIKGVHIIRKCETVNINGTDVDFVPFTLNPIKAFENLTDSESPVLCGHLSIDGAKFNTFYNTYSDIAVEYDGDMVKVDSKKFTKWSKVFLGHYHAAQKINHIEYVGSPLQLNFAEAFQEKHIIELDLDTLEQVYIKNNFSPKHIIANQNDDMSKYDLENSFVKLISDNLGSLSIVESRNELMSKYNILTLEFSTPKSDNDIETKSQIQDAQNIVIQNKDEMLEQYLKSKTIPSNLDFNRLISIGREICQKSQVK